MINNYQLVFVPSRGKKQNMNHVKNPKFTCVNVGQSEGEILHQVNQV